MLRVFLLLGTLLTQFPSPAGPVQESALRSPVVQPDLGSGVERFGRRDATLVGKISYAGPESGTIRVRAYALPLREDGSWRMISKEDVLGGTEPAGGVDIQGPDQYRISGLPEGPYAVVAFLDLDGDGTLDFLPAEPMGWYAAEAGGWLGGVEVESGGETRADLLLRHPTPFPAGDRSVEHGALRRMKGMPVLQLHGTARERGYAHGLLVGEQIKDFFEFYVIEDSWRSARRYQDDFVPFLETHFDYDPEYLQEVDAVVEGMRASGMEMRVEWLGRPFERVDLLAINAYIERRAAQPSPAAGESCSQFAFWGEATEGSELEGGLIAGRNMDGEVDLRKVTVSHFLLFAVTPSEPGRKRWISAMWPGFVGTISGINEDGLYSMENAGGSGPGPVVDGLTPCSWVQRSILEKGGGGSTVASVQEQIEAFRSAGGGSFGAGSIILWAVPYQGQTAPAFVSEGDRFGTAMRGPGEVPPFSPFNIMATNHYRVYGVDPADPDRFFGKASSFSSLWRYETGRHTLDAWTRQGRAVGTEAMRQLLQNVAHGTTEYSVIFRANEMSVDVAVDDLATDLWDAPFQEWVTFHFDELFAGTGRSGRGGGRP